MAPKATLLSVEGGWIDVDSDKIDQVCLRVRCNLADFQITHAIVAEVMGRAKQSSVINIKKDPK